MQDVKVYENEIIGFPYPAFASSQWDYDTSREHKDFEIYNNLITDCAWGMPNDYQKALFYPADANRISIHDNTIKWVNKNTTLYVLAASDNALNLEFVRNKQITENSFMITNINVPTIDTATVNVDVNNLGYRESDGSPTGVLIPKKIGEDLFDATNKNFYKAIGLTKTDWKLIS